MVHSGARSTLAVGAVIAGTYAIERLVGKGGMGAVFLASHARLPGKKVAIKVLHADVADEESFARFRREAEIASRLGHANIVEVHDFNLLEDGTPYLVLEFLEGESLAQRLARGALTLDQTITIVRQVASALAAAHREGIVHRDLKPANVFLVPVEGDGFHTERAKVLDFGISKIRGSTTIKTQDTSILGTPQYMSPEQALGNHAAVDARTDVFALGAMVYEMLAGQPAFGGASVPEVVFKVVYEEPPPLGSLVPGLPPHVLDAVARALAKKAPERWADVASFIEAFSGQPLSTGKRPLTGVAPPGGALDAPPTPKKSTKEAFAQTMGSGDHAQAAIAVQATVQSGQHAPAPATPAPTPMPTGAGVGAGAGPQQVSVSVAPTMMAPTPSPKGKGGLVIGGLAIVALTAVTIVYLVTRPPAASTPKVEPTAAITIDAGAEPKPQPKPQPQPAAIDAGAADPKPQPTAVDAGAKKVTPKKTRPDAGVTDEKPDKDEPDEDSAALSDCRKQLSSDPDDALRCANLLLESNPKMAGAHVVRVQAYCAMQDQEKAQSAIRKLNPRPRLRKKAAAYCARLGFDLQ
jgi:serine/threonine-protein kinase